jgi:hypothetical protein
MKRKWWQPFVDKEAELLPCSGVRFISFLNFPVFIADLIMSHVDCLTELMWRSVALQLNNGEILRDGASGQRRELPLGTRYICDRPSCNCGLHKKGYVNAQPSLICSDKVYEVKSISILCSKEKNNPRWGESQWEQYYKNEIMPCVTFYYYPLYYRGSMNKKPQDSTSDDYIIDKAKFKGKAKLIDVDTGEVLIQGITLPDYYGKDKDDDVARLTFMITDNSVQVRELAYQCLDELFSDVMLSKKYPNRNMVDQKFLELEWFKTKFHAETVYLTKDGYFFRNTFKGE